MDARAKTVRELLHSGDQYLIPFFQRYYSWSQRHWERLLGDVWALAEAPDTGSQHFLGPLVCTPAVQIPGEVPSYQLIDGQQRLTTLTLLLSATRDVAKDRGFDELADEITEDYLIHKRKKGLQRYKVVPRVGDREVMIGVVEGNAPAKSKKQGTFRGWRFFRKQIDAWATEEGESQLRRLFDATKGQLSLVVITIDGENPYEIFESLNSTGLPLEESDLIRNFLFMQVPIRDQEDFHSDHWSALESMFEEANGYAEIPATPFYRAYLMRKGTYSRAESTFVDFKEQNRKRSLAPADQVTELERFLRYELLLRRPETCEDLPLRDRLEQISTLEVTTAHPLLMHLLDCEEAGHLAPETLLACLDDLISFVLRRSICGETSRSYGTWFVEAIAAIKESPQDDLQKYWFRRGWPDDRAFIPRLRDFPIYRRELRKCRLILQRLEASYGHKEKVDPTTLSIEHVMPQTISNSKSGKEWQAMLGQGWESIHETHLHTLGNLTLTGYNQNLSNRPFPEKQAGLAGSNLVLNKVFADLQVWNAETIEARGEKLATEVAQLWQRPEGGDYVPPVEPTTSKLSPAEQRSLRLDYWTKFLSTVDDRSVIKKQPKPSDRGAIGFPLGHRGIRLRCYLNLMKGHIGVSLLCRGPQGKTNFSALREHRKAIETELGEKLQWLEQPKQQASQITKRLSGMSPEQRDDWEEQHNWLCDQLEAFHEVFSRYCSKIGSPEPEGDNRLALRKRFWTQLLERASERTQLHAGRSPGVEHWIGTGAGISGLAYNYVIRKKHGTVELYISRGKGKMAENKEIFDRLLLHKDSIEHTFGGELDWQRLDAKQGCRVAWHFDADGYRSPESNWPVIQDEMISAMIRLEDAFAPHLAAIKSEGHEASGEASESMPASDA